MYAAALTEAVNSDLCESFGILSKRCSALQEGFMYLRSKPIAFSKYFAAKLPSSQVEVHGHSFFTRNTAISGAKVFLKDHNLKPNYHFFLRLLQQHQLINISSPEWYWLDLPLKCCDLLIILLAHFKTVSIRMAPK